MSLDLTTTEDNIRAWALSASGRDVVWGKFDGEQPNSPFVSLNTDTIGKNHEDHVGAEVDDSNEITISSQRTMNVNVLVLGSSDDENVSAMQVASNLRSSLEKPSVQTSLRDNGISIVDLTDPLDVSFLYGGTAWEKRASFDITFGVSFVQKDSVGYFDDIEIGGEIKDELNETIRTVDITVP